MINWTTRRILTEATVKCLPGQMLQRPMSRTLKIQKLQQYRPSSKSEGVTYFIFVQFPCFVEETFRLKRVWFGIRFFVPQYRPIRTSELILIHASICEQKTKLTRYYQIPANPWEWACPCTNCPPSTCEEDLITERYCQYHLSVPQHTPEGEAPT